jgi:hypothetical protein
LGFRQLLFQLYNSVFAGLDILRLAQGDAALQGDVLVQFIVQRLLLLKKSVFRLVSGGIHTLCVDSFEASLTKSFRHDAWGLPRHFKKIQLILL